MVEHGMQVTLPAEVRAELLAHAREAMPNECCGLLSAAAAPLTRGPRAESGGGPDALSDRSPGSHRSDENRPRKGSTWSAHTILTPVGSRRLHRRILRRPPAEPDFLYVIVAPAPGTSCGYFVENGEVIAVRVDLVRSRRRELHHRGRSPTTFSFCFRRNEMR